MDFPAEQNGSFTLQVLQILHGNRIEVAIPYGDIGVLAGLERADTVLEK